MGQISSKSNPPCLPPYYIVEAFDSDQKVDPIPIQRIDVSIQSSSTIHSHPKTIYLQRTFLFFFCGYRDSIWPRECAFKTSPATHFLSPKPSRDSTSNLFPKTFTNCSRNIRPGFYNVHYLPPKASMTC